MRNASMEFENVMQERRDFYYTARINFADGKSMDLGTDDIVVSGNSMTESGDLSSFPLGCAIGKRITLEIRNNEDQFSEYDFYNAVIRVYLKFDLSDNTEIIDLGKYTVRDPESYGSTISITAIDDMYKADTAFTGTGFPKTVAQGLLDCCNSCGLTLLTTEFANNDFVINNTPTGITNRQFIGLCAMIAGGNAVADEYGRVQIKTYDFSVFDQKGIFYGGIFDEETPYSSGDTINGGAFSPWSSGDTANGGTFLDSDKYHVFHKFQNLSIATDDVVITGVQITANDITYRKGTEGYVLELENQLVSGNEADAVNRIGNLIIGLKFRPFTMDHICYPLAEFGDLCYLLDRKNRCYQSVITDVDFAFRGFTVIKCSADSPQRNSSKYNSNAEVKAIVASREEAKRQVTEYDKTIQILTSIMANSLGMFQTVERTESGGKIVYQHNKPNLSDSNIIWKKTENAFTVSTDGGNTWNAGIDADGNAVVNVLSAIGIQFDWARGGTLTLGGYNNQNGLLRILNENGEEVGFLSSSGIFLKSGSNQSNYFEFESQKYTSHIRGDIFVFLETTTKDWICDFEMSDISGEEHSLSLTLREKAKSFNIIDYEKSKKLFGFNKNGNFENSGDISVGGNASIGGNITTASKSQINGVNIGSIISGANSGSSIQSKMNSAYSGSLSIVTRVEAHTYYSCFVTIENGLIKSVGSETAHTILGS